MLEYRVTGDIREIERHLSGLAREQVPFATALALTRTAQFVARKEVEEMQRVFDRPTRWTLNSTFVQPATKQRLWAMVKIKDEGTGRIAQIKYLQAQIYGGSRGHKGFENLLLRYGRMPPGHYAVPASGAVLDQHGNVKGSEITKILSDVRAQFDPAQNATVVSRERRMRARKRRPTFYFSTHPVNMKTRHLRPGIYRRTHFAFGAPIKPVFIFVRRIRYRKRLRFFEIADQTARMRFPIEFGLAMRQALRTARRPMARAA